VRREGEMVGVIHRLILLQRRKGLLEDRWKHAKLEATDGIFCTMSGCAFCIASVPICIGAKGTIKRGSWPYVLSLWTQRQRLVVAAAIANRKVDGRAENAFREL
jgi:hypothetical protein